MMQRIFCEDRNSDAGPTTGSSVIYEVVNVPADVREDDVMEAIKKSYRAVPHNAAYEVEYATLAG